LGAKYTTTLEGLMGDGKALQMGTSHNLGQNFSKPFEIKYLGKDTREHFVWQTSWGVSWRLIGALIMVHGDDKGLILPPRIAPIQVVIVPIFKNENADIIKTKAYEIACELKKVGVRVYVDDREEYTSGWKFNEWEIKGVPLRINIGPRDIENHKVELVRRDNKEKILVDRVKLTEHVIALLDEIQGNLLNRAKKNLEDSTTTTTNYDILKSTVENKGGFVLAGWCTSRQCEDKIKEETGADIRVIPFVGQEQFSSTICIYCRQPAKKIAVFARSY
jgi:prolyl-tRNA synthetase